MKILPRRLPTDNRAFVAELDRLLDASEEDEADERRCEVKGSALNDHGAAIALPTDQ